MLNGSKTLIIGLGALAVAGLCVAGAWTHADDSRNESARAVLLDPQSTPSAVLYHAFLESGWSSEQAMQHATSALGNSPGGGGQEMDTCAVRYMEIIWCDSQNTAHRRMAWLEANCADQIDDCIDQELICPLGSPHKFMKFTTQNDCFGSGVPNGSCVRIFLGTTVEWGSCDGVVHCDCFVESDPLDCEDVETVCCPSGGC